MRPRQNLQLARVFGIRIGVSASWFLFLFFVIYWLGHDYFPNVARGSHSADYLVAVAGALAYFGSLILHELGHALAARRAGIEIAGIDLWFFGGLSQLRREPATAGEELAVAAAGPAVTLLIVAVSYGAIEAFAPGEFGTAVLPASGAALSPGLALAGWIALINAVLLVFNVIPAFPLDGGRIARGLIWWRSGDRNRATQATGRSGQALAGLVALLGLWGFATSGSVLALFTMILAFFLFQAAGAAVVQGSLGRRIEKLTVADIMDRDPVTIPAQTSLLDAEEGYFLRYRWPWFAVVDEDRRFVGVVRSQRVEDEIAAGRPALPVADVIDDDLAVRIGCEAPLESLMRSEGLGRLGAMVAVDGDGILRGVVTVAELRKALRPAT